MGNHKDKIRRHDSGGRMDGSELNQLEQKCHGTCMGRDKPPMQEHAQQSWGGLNIAKPAYFMNQQWFNVMNAHFTCAIAKMTRSRMPLDVMERSFVIEWTYYCLYVRLHLLYLCVAAE
jgi:hypothetical protein